MHAYLQNVNLEVEIEEEEAGISIVFSGKKPVWSWKSEYCMVSEFNPWTVFSLNCSSCCDWILCVINWIVSVVIKWMIVATWFKERTHNLFLLSTLPKCCSSHTAINFFPWMIRYTTAIHSFIIYSRNSMFLHAMSTVTICIENTVATISIVKLRWGFVLPKFLVTQITPLQCPQRHLQISNDDKVRIWTG